MIPKTPSKSESATSNQTDSDKHTRRRRQHSSTLVFRERGSGFRMRSNSPIYLTKELPLFLLQSPYMERRWDSLEWSSLPKIIDDSEPDHRLQSKRPPSKSPLTAEPCHKDWCFVTGSSRRLTFHLEHTPKRWELDHHPLHLSFLHLIKRRKGYKWLDKTAGEEFRD